MTTSEQIIADVDASLTSLGFTRSTTLAQVKWRGETHNRACLISIAPRKRTRHSGGVRGSELLGYVLRIDLGIAVSVRLLFVRSAFAHSAIVRWVYRLRRQKVIAEVPAALQGFCGVTTDPDWSRRLLLDPDAIAATASLLRQDAKPDFAGSVYFGPDTLYYASPIVPLQRLTALRTLTALDQLETVAVAAERLPAPVKPARMTWLEALTKRSPLLSVLVIIGGLMAVVAFGVGLVIALAALLLR